MTTLNPCPYCTGEFKSLNGHLSNSDCAKFACIKSRVEFTATHGEEAAKKFNRYATPDEYCKLRNQINKTKKARASK